MHREHDIGDLKIQFTKRNIIEPMVFTIRDMHASDFMTLMKTGCDGLSGFSNIPIYINQISTKAHNDSLPPQDAAKLTSINPGFGNTSLLRESLKESSDSAKEHEMSDLNRNEIQAMLKANKAEADAVASSMRTEMANFRTAYVESFADISKTLSRIESRADATEKRLTQAQWIVSLVISICAVTLSAVIFFSNKNPVKSPPQSTVVINTSGSVADRPKLDNDLKPAPTPAQSEDLNPSQAR